MRIFSLVVALSAIFVPVTVMAGSAADSALPGRPGLIATGYYGEDGRGLTLISPTGKGRRLLAGTRTGAEPAFSPDGRTLAFTQARVRSDGRSIVSSLYVIRPDGTGRRRILDEVEAPAWSPDGNRIVFMRDACRTEACRRRVDNAYELFTTTLSGRVRRLTHNRDFDGYPAYSPDGSKIAFSGPDGIYVMNADGTGRRRLTRRSDTNPSWSPDGRTIVFQGFGPESADIFAIRRSGEARRRLTFNRGPDLAPVFSPDGRRIAFLSNSVCARSGGCTGETPSAVWVMNADGSGRRRLTNNSGYGPPDWQRLPGTG